jgi:hypothetical protein
LVKPDARSGGRDRGRYFRAGKKCDAKIAKIAEIAEIAKRKLFGLFPYDLCDLCAVRRLTQVYGS